MLVLPFVAKTGSSDEKIVTKPWLLQVLQRQPWNAFKREDSPARSYQRSCQHGNSHRPIEITGLEMKREGSMHLVPAGLGLEICSLFMSFSI